MKVCKPFFEKYKDPTTGLLPVRVYDLKAVAAIEVPVIKAKRTITTSSSGASSQKRQRKEPLVTTWTDTITSKNQREASVALPAILANGLPLSVLDGAEWDTLRL